MEQANLTNHVVLQDSQKQLRLTVAAAHSPNLTGNTLSEEIYLVEASHPSPAAQKITEQISQELEKLSISAIRFQWGSDVSQLNSKTCIVLTDLEKSLLLQASSTDFQAAQRMILEAESLLWVSGPLGPDSHLASGLARSIRSEVAGIKFRTLQITCTPVESAVQFSSMVLRVLQSSAPDQEFVTEGGLVTVSRFFEDKRRNEVLATALGKYDPKPELMSLKAAGGPVKLGVGNPGMLDTLCFEPDTIPETPLAPEEVEVQVKASGVKYVSCLLFYHFILLLLIQVIASVMSWWQWVKSRISCSDSRLLDLSPESLSTLKT